jgi:hypothetical protein
MGAGRTLLATKKFDGNVLLLGSRAPMVAAVQNLGKELAMLPILATPFNVENLRDSVAALLPNQPLPNPQVDVTSVTY